MPATGIDHATTAVPVLRYRDLPAAVDWLCRTLGFEKHRVVNGEGGSIRLAQLTLGSGIVMLAPVQKTELDKLMVQPDEVGGAETQITYFFVADTAAHFARAKAAGAEIVLDNSDKNQSKRGYSCRDPEGHIWSFGSYNPSMQPDDRTTIEGGSRLASAVRALSMSLSLTLIVFAAAVGWVYSDSRSLIPGVDPTQAVGVSSRPDAIKAEAGSESQRSVNEAAEFAAREASERLAQALQREREEMAARTKLLQELAQARGAKAEAEQAAEQALAELNRHQREREASERAIEEALRQLSRERSAREAAELAVQDARGLLAKERSIRESAQRTSRDLEARLARERSARKAPQKASPGSSVDLP